MGFFGGGNGGGLVDSSDPNELLNQQIQQSEAELEAKRMNLYKQKLDVIKSEGNQLWTPDRSAGVPDNNGYPMGNQN